MNRRNFLKSAAAAVVTALVAPAALFTERPKVEKSIAKISDSFQGYERIAGTRTYRNSRTGHHQIDASFFEDTAKPLPEISHYNVYRTGGDWSNLQKIGEISAPGAGDFNPIFYCSEAYYRNHVKIHISPSETPPTA